LTINQITAIFPTVYHLCNGKSIIMSCIFTISYSQHSGFPQHGKGGLRSLPIMYATPVLLSDLAFSSLSPLANVSSTGGSQYNSPHHQQGGAHQSPDRKFPYAHLLYTHLSSTPYAIVDHEQIVQSAQDGGSGDSSMFSSALGFMQQNKVDNRPLLPPSPMILFNGFHLARARRPCRRGCSAKCSQGSL
jgi:hypothetical protein